MKTFSFYNILFIAFEIRIVPLVSRFPPTFLEDGNKNKKIFFNRASLPIEISKDKNWIWDLKSNKRKIDILTRKKFGYRQVVERQRCASIDRLTRTWILWNPFCIHLSMKQKCRFLRSWQFIEVIVKIWNNCYHCWSIIRELLNT